MITANDYYPFGSQMPGRKYSQPNTKYRYGFNGKENDKDAGEGIQDYGMRIYDVRLGKFLSVDPIGNEYPWNSTYAFAEGDPINFIDLDGLERATPPRPGSGRGARVTGLRSFAQSQAEGVVQAVRANRTARERLEAIRHIRQMNTNPTYASNYRSNNVLLSRVARENYINNAFNAASSVFGGGNVRDNYKAGEKWDNIVHATMLQNPNYIGVARQISLKVTGTVNGQTVVANIRVDNVGISKDASGKFLFNLVEAKYSINDITINNVKQTLTPQQKVTDYILLNGKDVHFYIRGEGSAVKVNEASKGNAFNKDQDVTGNISQITVVAPSSNSSQSNSSTNAPTTPKPPNTPNP